MEHARGVTPATRGAGGRVRAVRNLLSVALAFAVAFGMVPAAGGATASLPDRGTAFSGAKPDTKSKSAEPEYVSGEVIVRFASGATAAQKSRAVVAAGARGASAISAEIPAIAVSKLKSGVSVEEAVAAYEEQPGVLYAQPNYIKHVASVPNDPGFGGQWGLNNTGQFGGTADADVDAPEAWDIATGSSSTVVAVIDTGIDFTHPEFQGRLWTNPGEIAGNGIDDDNNGYVDDVHGADVVNDDGDPFDDNGHGTHCAGTIGARSNNSVGIAGLNRDVRIMAVKMLDWSGSGTTASSIAAIAYVKSMNVRICNVSLGGYYAFDQAEYDAMAAASSTLFVCAAGNYGDNIDADPFYPAAYPLPNILSVGASDADDALVDSWWGSNYGATSVDLVAPGDEITSTIPADRTFVPAGSAAFSDDMSSLDAWNSQTDDVDSWEIVTDEYVSSPSAVAVRDYSDGQDSYLWLKSGVDIPAGTSASLDFQMLLDTEPDYDGVLIYAASSEKPTWRSLAGYSGSTGGEFEDVRLDLRDYVGDENVSILLYFTSDDYYGSYEDEGYTGVTIDDVRIETGSWNSDYSEAYEAWSGTSMATPHVTGIAALCLGLAPSATPAQLKSWVMNGADKKSALTGTCVTGARANAAGALNQIPGSVSGTLKDGSAAIAGATVRIAGKSATTASNGSFKISGISRGTYTYTLSKSAYYTKTGTVVVGPGKSVTLNQSLSRNVPKASISRSPSKSSLTYKRKKGKARFTLSATMRGWNNTKLTKRVVYLQTSKNGKTGWKNTYKLTTNSSGKASKSFKVKKKGTVYYRWYVPAKSGMNKSTTSSKQKVRVK